MKYTSLILSAAFAMVMVPTAFGQGTPSQSQDPNTQTPVTQQTPSAPQPTPSNPPASSSASSDTQYSFVGSIVKNGDKFMLHTGGAEYQLDDQAQAGKFEGKDVKVTGQVDQPSQTIRVQSIELASSM
jgi:uncharacterized protein YdeI (BOF family)